MKLQMQGFSVLRLVLEYILCKTICTGSGQSLATHTFRPKMPQASFLHLKRKKPLVETFEAFCSP
jgi:hypothetical protein